MPFPRQPLVSFVVPCYNYGRFLGDCLKSIFAQTATDDYEIIVINDGSTDNTESVVKAFCDERLIYIHHPVNLGHVATLNESLDKARGRYIARIDADDRYRSYFLRETLEVFRKFPNVGLVYGDVALMDEQGKILAEPWEGIRSRSVHGGKDYQGDEYLGLVEENVIPAPTVIAKREAWQDAFPIPDGFAFSDWYLNLRMARTYTFYYRACILADYRIHPQNLHAQPIRDRSFEHTVLRILDQIFSEPDRAAEKVRIRRRVYAKAYLNFADRYFGVGMDAEARRCYLRAFVYRPAYLLKPGPVWRMLATVIGHARYEALKARFRAWGK